MVNYENEREPTTARFEGESYFLKFHPNPFSYFKRGRVDINFDKKEEIVLAEKLFAQAKVYQQKIKKNCQKKRQTES